MKFIRLMVIGGGGGGDIFTNVIDLSHFIMLKRMYNIGFKQLCFILFLTPQHSEVFKLIILKVLDTQ